MIEGSQSSVVDNRGDSVLHSIAAPSYRIFNKLVKFLNKDIWCYREMDGGYSG